ncbi:MAG: LytR C-terminal domain-containing protein [Nostocoides sp.]
MSATRTAGHPQRTRQIRAAIVLIVALAFLGGAFYQAYSYIQDDSETPTTLASDCATGTAEQPIAKPSTVIVNVYNATDTVGLAAGVARSMRERGYEVGEIDNDPLEKSIKGVAEIRYGDSGRAAARSVRLAVRDAKLINDKRTDETVDLVIGDGYEKLSPAPTCATRAAG